MEVVLDTEQLPLVVLHSCAKLQEQPPAPNLPRRRRAPLPLLLFQRRQSPAGVLDGACHWSAGGAGRERSCVRRPGEAKPTLELGQRVPGTSLWPHVQRRGRGVGRAGRVTAPASWVARRGDAGTRTSQRFWRLGRCSPVSGRFRSGRESGRGSQPRSAQNLSSCVHHTGGGGFLGGRSRERGGCREVWVGESRLHPCPQRSPPCTRLT